MEARAKPGPGPSPADEPPGLPRASCRGERPSRQRGQRPTRGSTAGGQTPAELPRAPAGICGCPPCPAKLLPSAAREPSNSPSTPARSRSAGHRGGHGSLLPGDPAGVCVSGGGSGRPQEHGTCQAKLWPLRPLPPGLRRAVKYSSFLPLTGKVSSVLPTLSPPLLERDQGGKEGREGLLPSPCPSHPTEEPEAHTPGSADFRAPTNSHAAEADRPPRAPAGRRLRAWHCPAPGREPCWSGAFGESPSRAVPSEPRSLHLRMWRRCIISPLFLSP